MGISEALRLATQKLSLTSDSPRLDAELLMAHALDMERADMLLRRDDLQVPKFFQAILDRRSANEPIAYIIGKQDFWDLTLKVTPDVLIPRSDSETIIEWISEIYANNPPQNILDMGTGSGALLLAVLSVFPSARGIGIDNSQAAISVAKENAKINKISDRSEFITGDWTMPDWEKKLKVQFDLIISNPPYIGDDEQLMDDVAKFEPPQALYAGKDGLRDYKLLIPKLGKLLTKNGHILLEIGHTQAQSVTEIAYSNFCKVNVKQDLAGLDRVLMLS